MTVEYDRPFAFALLAGPQTESGRSLGAEAELVPVLAKALYLLGQTPIRETAFGATNNLARTFESVNDDGSINCWASPGVAVLTFRGGELAGYFVSVAGEGTILEWAEAPVADGLRVLLDDVCHANRLHDLDAYMTVVYTPGHGEETLGDFASEAAALLRTERVRARDVDTRLDGLDRGFRARLRRVVDGSQERAVDAALGFAEDVRAKGMGTVDGAGPQSGSALVSSALDHLDALRDQLAEQRRSIMSDVAKVEAVTAGAVDSLKRAAARSRTGSLRGLRKPLAAYLAAAKEMFKARHGLEVTTIALEALTSARERLLQTRHDIEELRVSMKAAAACCRERRLAFESRPVTPVSEMVDRPIHDDAELRQLYRWASGTDWGTLPDDSSQAIRRRVGGLGTWTGEGADAIASSFDEACAPVFARVRAMTADGFVRWRRDELGKSPSSLLRDAAALASPLARFDRAAAPPDEYEERVIAILGVTDREASVFAGTPQLTLVSTGDPDSVAYLVLTPGHASGTLWHHAEYLEANQAVRRGGRVAHQIYPGFPPPPLPGRGRRRRGKGR